MNELDEQVDLRIQIAKIHRYKCVTKGGLFYILHPDVNITVTPGYPSEIAAWYDAFTRSIPNWPGDMNAAWKLVEEMRCSKATIAVENGFGDPPGDYEVLAWDSSGQIFEDFVECDKVPAALSRAYLAWKEAALAAAEGKQEGEG